MGPRKRSFGAKWRLWSLIAAAICPMVLYSSASPAQTIAELPDALDRFAASHLDKVQQLSFRDGIEYCGLFGLDRDGELAATPPRPGTRFECTPMDEPPVVEVLASYHTHASFDIDADGEAPSIGDLTSDFEEGIDGYIGTPGGRVWVNMVDEEVSVLLCGPGCISVAPGFKECPAFLPADEYTIEDLKRRRDRDTGKC